MLRSMFTAITALNLNQTFMDVISDNLANSNTPGYKESKVSFQSQFSQLMQVGAAPASGLGGTNPTQIGLGATLGYISPDFTQGTMTATNRNLDLAIEGEGFFVYRDATSQYFSRDGGLSMDASGTLVSASTGQRIQGWTSGSGGAIDPGMPLGDISIPIDTSLARTTNNLSVGGNLDSTSPIGVGSEKYVTVGVYDTLGQVRSVTIQFTRTGLSGWNWAVSSGGAGNGTLTFDTNGQITAGGGNFTIPPQNGSTGSTIALNTNNITQLATANSVTASSQDGLEAGTLSGFKIISNTGEIYGLYSNGLQQLIGQLGIAKFVNPPGLIRTGQNLFQTGLNSGVAQIGIAATAGRGTIASGYSEASNVDLATEFTSMILAQRGFQASARVITTSDQMLQELVNIKQ
jgi:flagellar hook protein FlgE